MKRDGGIIIHECREKTDKLGVIRTASIKIWQNDFNRWFMDVNSECIVPDSRTDYPITYCPYCGMLLHETEYRDS